MPPCAACDALLVITPAVAVQLTLPDSKPGLSNSCCVPPPLDTVSVTGTVTGVLVAPVALIVIAPL